MNYDSRRHFIRTRGYFWISGSGLWTCQRCPKKRISRFRCQIRVYYTFLFFIFALGFLRRSSLSDNAEQASQKMLSWPTLGAPVRAAAAAGEMARMRAWHACSEQSCGHAFSKPACACSGCRCRPRKHFLRSLFGIVTKRRTSQKYFEHARNSKHDKGGRDWSRDRRNENFIPGRS